MWCRDSPASVDLLRPPGSLTLGQRVCVGKQSSGSGAAARAMSPGCTQATEERTWRLFWDVSGASMTAVRCLFTSAAELFVLEMLRGGRPAAAQPASIYI